MYEQDRVLARLQQRVNREPAIKACFLGGSYGRRAADPYADLDVALVFADETARAAAFADRHAFVRSVVPYVPAKSFDADHIRPYFHIALYANGAKVDYRYETQTELQPNAWDREIRLLKDSDGWGAAFQAAAPLETPRQPVPTAAELAALDNRFWVMFWDTWRQVQRGDMAKPFPVYVCLLTFSLPPLLGLLPPEASNHQALLKAVWDAPTTTSAHLRALLDAYVAARTAVITRHHIPYSPDTTFESQLRRAMERNN